METGLQKLNHQQKAVQWGERIASCRSSGLTVRQWCSENGISAGSYYKWQRRLYQMTAGDGPQFIEVTPHQPARDPAAVIHIRDTEVEILPGIDSGEHDNQLNRYRRQVEEAYPDYKKMYIYLSPKGMEASDPDNWCSMSYEDVLNIVESARRKVKLLPDAQLLIYNYIDTIRRDIVGDERLARICAEIYAKHQKALDLIFENRLDRSSELAEIIHAWAAEMTTKGELAMANPLYIPPF